MKLKEIEEVPDKRYAEYAELVNEFISSGMKCAEVTDFKCGPYNAAGTLRKYIERHGLPVRAGQRKGRVFLARTDYEVV